MVVLSFPYSPISLMYPSSLFYQHYRRFARVTEKPLAWALQKSSSENWQGPWFEERVMYRRIMVVTGDQSWSDIPVKYAIALAAETGAELSILMVLTPPLIAGMSDVTACTLVVESIMDQSATALADIVVIAEQAGIAYTTRVRWGSTADAVLRTAEEEDCDLVIVGAHACTWRSHRLLRHIIKKLTTFARQPLLVVTEPPEETYRGLAGRACLSCTMAPPRARQL